MERTPLMVHGAMPSERPEMNSQVTKQGPRPMSVDIGNNADPWDTAWKVVAEPFGIAASISGSRELVGSIPGKMQFDTFLTGAAPAK